MAQETLRYLRDEGAHQITIVNRSYDRASDVAAQWKGRAVAWDQLAEALATSDIVVSTTGATEPIVALAEFGRIERARFGRPLFILDLAVLAISTRPSAGGPTFISIRSTICKRPASGTQQQRDRELPHALRIIEHETARFMGEISHRAVAPVIQQLREGWQSRRKRNSSGCFTSCRTSTAARRRKIRQSFDRLVNKLLHPPLTSLRDESRKGVPRTLLNALARLFQLKD